MSLQLAEEHKWESILCNEEAATVGVCQYNWNLGTVTFCFVYNNVLFTCTTLTPSLLVLSNDNFCKLIGSRSGPTERRAGSGS